MAEKERSPLSFYMSEMGRKGGKSKSDRKRDASRKNAAKARAARLKGKR